ncbi:hypothetical protein EVAR_464_1 [Eumeta japonica]|uniref:HAT C-terminal dimerisation domain-containing protein n=1 Tax=Eumeta variegata TaxID=151549 RepID=A0A4C1SDG9_EUMVA|nr:hypothetical protein EVAR_464_1 [Eumeta japonica]
MSRTAKVYLCCPASSVYSERLFSGPKTYMKQRNRLLPERAEALVFLHHNLLLIKKYNYDDDKPNARYYGMLRSDGRRGGRMEQGRSR